MAYKKKTTKDVLEKLPPIYSLIAHEHIDFNTHNWLIRCRIKDLGKKPPLFIWDLTTNTYVSGLIPVQETDQQIIFKLDLLENGQRKRLFLAADNNGNMEIAESLDNVA